MSSSFAAIPKNAPFAEEEIDLLNRVVGPANAIQRAWLAGFLAGVELVTGQAQPAAPAKPAEPIDDRLRQRVPAIARSSPTISPRPRVKMA